MILLILFAFLGGVVTILSPCILPILPIVLSGSVGSGKRKPLGIVTGFVFSFTFFTLFLSAIVKVTGVSADALRSISIVIILLFGLSLLLPQFQVFMEKLFSKLSNRFAVRGTHEGFLGGVFVGLSLGLIWTPCVGPILASVITLAATSNVTAAAFLITFAYALGTALPMLAIMYGGRSLLQKLPWLLPNTGRIQKAFGVLMVLTAIGIFFNIDRRFQSYILDIFPEYGVGLTSFEDNQAVRSQLDKLFQKNVDKNSLGKPMNEMVLPKGPIAPEIIPGGAWFNSEPLTLKELRGKVVIIDFWTYSCINCQRTLPYLRQWHEKYHDKGLVIIGVHSPEFEFEKNEKNVAQAISDFKLKYPIVQDNEFATWRAYNNRYWPAKYFIDKEGHIRFTHFGEGAYDESERLIQELLRETGASGLPSQVSNPTYQIMAKTPETYLGYGRIAGFASPENIKKDAPAIYTAPANLGNNQVAFEGKWLVAEEYANPQKGAKLLLNFEAKEVFLVMRSAKPGTVQNQVKQNAKAKVYLDGKLVDSQKAGADVKNGEVTVDSDRLYKLINLPTPGRHLLRLEFEDSNTQLFAFTFG